MAKRGRPKKVGGDPPWRLLRATIALAAFEKARAAGKTERAAIRAAVAAVHAKFRFMRMSETEVKRLRAEFQPSRQGEVFRFNEAQDNQWTISFAERPKYPRHPQQKHRFVYSRRFNRS